jgi:hypothetical protein
MMPSNINDIVADIAPLRTEAMEKGEAFRTVVKNETVRVNLAARRDSEKIEYTLEVLVRLVGAGNELDADELDAGVSRTKSLFARGYAPGEQEEAWACCEKNIVEEQITEELTALALTMGGRQ